MAISVSSSGTQTAVIGTEHSLAAPTTAGFYQLHVDMINLASGDVVELRVKEKILGAGTIRVLFYAKYEGAQDAEDLIKMSIPVPSDVGVTCTLKQVAGTGRNFDWKLLTW